MQISAKQVVAQALATGNRWRVCIVRPNGSIGTTFYCGTPAELRLVVGMLDFSDCSFSVDAYFVQGLPA